MRKLKLNRQAFIDWIYIIFGTFLTGFGISVFMNPARLAPGGVSGLGTIIYHVIEDKTGKALHTLYRPYKRHRHRASNEDRK